MSLLYRIGNYFGGIQSDQAPLTKQDDNENEAKDHESDDKIVKLDFESQEFYRLRLFLRWTVQRIPEHCSTVTRIVLHVVQFLVVLAFLFIYFYDFGIFGNTTLVAEEWDSGNTVTSVKYVIWNLRFSVLYIVGILFFRKRHLENVLSKVLLSRKYWRRARKVIIFNVVAIILCVVVFPVCSKVVQMLVPPENKSVPFELWEIIVHSLFSVVVRTLPLTILFAFIVVVFIIYYHIRFYKKEIKKWPNKNVVQARNDFNNIRTVIKDSGRAFQPFVILHLSVLLIVFVPAIVSCVERAQTEAEYLKLSYTAPSLGLEKPIQTRPLDIIIPTTLIITKHENFMAKHNVTLSLRGAENILVGSSNKTKQSQENFNSHITEHKIWFIDVKAILRLVFGVFTELVEMLVLYSLPIIILGKIDKCIKEIPEVVETLCFDEQKENGYLFQSRQMMDELLPDLRKGQGMQVLGMDLTSFRTVMITFITPVILVLFRLMFRQVNMQ